MTRMTTESNGVPHTDALAEYWHRRICEELHFASGTPASSEDADDVTKFFRLGYRDARFSPGYGACPNLEDRSKIVAHHPEAKYFNT